MGQAMPAFPDFVILRLGTTHQDASLVERSDVERGPAKTRRTSTDPVVTASGTLLFAQQADIAAFRAWLYSAAGANAGAAWIDWVDPRTGTTRRIRFVSLGALIPLSGRFALAQQPIVFEYIDTIEEIAAGAR